MTLKLGRLIQVEQAAFVEHLTQSLKTSVENVSVSAKLQKEKKNSIVLLSLPVFYYQ